MAVQGKAALDRFHPLVQVRHARARLLSVRQRAQLATSPNALFGCSCLVAGTCNHRFLPNHRASDPFPTLLALHRSPIAAPAIVRFLSLVERQIPALAA